MIARRVVMAALVVALGLPGETDAQATPVGMEAFVERMLERANGAVGLPALHEAALAPGTRELRFVALEGGMIWHWAPLLRIVQTPDTLFGELYLYWPDQLDSTGTRLGPWWVTRAPPECLPRQFIPEWSSCRLSMWDASWPVVADSLNRLGVWSLFPRAGALRRGSQLTDGPGILGEVRIGDHYGSLWYYNPELLSGPEVLPLRRVAALVMRLARW